MFSKFSAVSLVALTLACGAARAEVAPPEAMIEATEAESDAIIELQLAAAKVPQDVVDFLADERPLSELSDKELSQRFRLARGLYRQQGLDDKTRKQLKSIADDSRAELGRRSKADAQPEKKAEAEIEEPPVKKRKVVVAPEVEEPQPEKPREQSKFGEDNSVSPLMRPRKPVVVVAEPSPRKKPPAIRVAEAEKLDENPVSADSELKARRLLADPVPASDLPDRALKARLNAMRDLMGTNTLSPRTERALRQRLQKDRLILRTRTVEKVEAEEERKPEQSKPRISDRTPPREVLQDRRGGDELSPRELRRRLRVNSGVEAGEIADAQGNRDYRRELIRRDREALRRKLLEERRARAIELERNSASVDIVIQREYQPSRQIPRSVFEAEADDSEIEDILVSAPRRRVQQRYTIEEISAREDLRDTMPRIEIDTIRFGFNEAFVREEEVENLDRIAAIIERVLRKNPREIFLIEGHTDAVGSDVYNINLSRQRAEAVKRALTTYYVISPRNLQTTGLGERYLKIPTSEAEGENRRVSLSRATPLLGELRE